MMTGTITDIRPHTELFIKGFNEQGVVEFTIDTGYTGTFTLPLATCEALQLESLPDVFSYLADGTRLAVRAFVLSVEWDNDERNVEILSIGQEPLLGATMLEGYELCLNYVTSTLVIKTA